MQFTKPMIELVLEIRRRVPSDLKPEIKLANPELFEQLRIFYYSKPNAISTALIKKLFTLAGRPWDSMLTDSDITAPKTSVNVYRGTTSHTETEGSSDLSRQNSGKAKRIYRGQVVG